MCRIDRRWKERLSNPRGKPRTSSRGANRPATRWPPVLHEITVLGGIKHALAALGGFAVLDTASAP
jgi:hypothetical protein